MKSFLKTTVFASIVIVVSGCGTSPSYQPQPQRQLTPLEACLNEAKRAEARCSLPHLFQNRPQEIRACEDRELIQQDRCYARFK